MAAVVKVFADKLNSSVYEQCFIKEGQTFEGWLCENVPSYDDKLAPLFSVALNGAELLPLNWSVYRALNDDVFEVTVEAKEPATIVFAIVAVVATAASIYALSQIPDSYNTTTPEGSPIYDVNAQGNRPRLMGVIPELAGTHQVYPDTLNQPRRKYVDNEQWLYLLMAVGVGEHEFTEDDIYIGNTPIGRYVEDIDYQVFGPGEDVSSHESHRNFYQSPEVGGNGGLGGLEVKAYANRYVAKGTYGNRYIYTKTRGPGDHVMALASSPSDSSVGHISFPFPGGSEFQFDGLNYSQVIFEGVVDLVSNGVGVADEITAPFGLNVASVGDEIQIVGAGDNDGTYKVDSVSSTSIALNDLNDNPVDLLHTGTSVYIRLLKEHNFFGLYQIDWLENGTWAHVSRPNDPNWVGFPEEIFWYNVDMELVNGDLERPFVGPFLACPAKEKTQLIQLDFSFDQGLGVLNDGGGVSARTVDIIIKYRDADSGGDYTEVPYSFTASTLDQVAETVEIILPQVIKPEVLVERVTLETDDIKVKETLTWEALRSELETVTTYPDVTTIAVKIRGTNALSSSAENKFNIISTRKLPTLQGGAWGASAPSNDIADFFGYVVKDAGFSDDAIDLDELERLASVWRGRGDTFAGVFDSESTFFAVLKRVLEVGFAEPTLDYGQIIPVRDEPRSEYEHMYQPGNMLKGGLERTIDVIDLDEPDGVEVEYFNSETWKPETVVCLLPGDLGVNLEKVRAFGITDKDKAYQFGMRKRRIRRYRRTQYSFKTEMDALNSRYLSYCALADDIPGYSQTGELVAVNGSTVVVSEPLDWSAPGVHYLSVRRSDGTLSGPYQCSKGDDDYSVVLNGFLDFTPVLDGSQVAPLFMFGVAERWCLPALITDVSPRGTEQVSVKAVNYDARVYEDDDSLAPA